MATNNQLQLQTSNNLPTIDTPQALAKIRMNESMYPHFNMVQRPARQEWLAGQIKYLASITRIRDLDAREALLMATALEDMIAQDAGMANLTFPEIADAFKNGVFGIYGEFFGLTAPNLYGFLDSFLRSEKKREATEIVLKSKEESYAEKKAAEIEKNLKKIRDEIEEAKRRGDFIPTGKIWFKPKTVDEAIDSSAHREKVRQQAKEILRQHDTDHEGGRPAPGAAQED